MKQTFSTHTNSVSTLPCETWNVHRARATIELLQKKTPVIIPLQLWLPNSSDLNPDDYSLRGLLQEKMYEIRITDLDELKQRPKTEWAINLDHVVIAAGNSSVASSIAADQW